jgi:hypothetical protein
VCGCRKANLATVSPSHAEGVLVIGEWASELESRCREPRQEELLEAVGCPP